MVLGGARPWAGIYALAFPQAEVCFTPCVCHSFPAYFCCGRHRTHVLRFRLIFHAYSSAASKKGAFLLFQGTKAFRMKGLCPNHRIKFVGCRSRGSNSPPSASEAQQIVMGYQMDLSLEATLGSK